MLGIYTDQVFSIGIVNAHACSRCCATARLHNVPDEALYGFDPTAISASTCPTHSGSTGEA